MECAVTDFAAASESVGITLSEQIFAERVRSRPESACLMNSPVSKPACSGLAETLPQRQTYRLKLASQEVDCEIDTIERVIDASTSRRSANRTRRRRRHSPS